MKTLVDSIVRLGLGAALFLEREAGYHAVSLILVGAGILLIDPQTRPSVAHDLIIFGTGVLARSMGAKKNSSDPS